MQHRPAPGIRAAVEQLLQTRDLHEVHHMVMEELELMLWESQQSGKAPDGAAYVERVRALV